MSTTNPNLEQQTVQSQNTGIPVRGGEKFPNLLVRPGTQGLITQPNNTSVDKLRELQTKTPLENLRQTKNTDSNNTNRFVESSQNQEPFNMQQQTVGILETGKMTRDSKEVFQRKSSAEGIKINNVAEKISVGAATPIQKEVNPNIISGRHSLRDLSNEITRSKAGAVKFSGEGGLGKLEKIFNSLNETLKD